MTKDSSKSFHFNDHVNIILLLMFMIVLVVLSLKGCNWFEAFDNGEERQNHQEATVTKDSSKTIVRKDTIASIKENE